MAALSAPPGLRPEESKSYDAAVELGDRNAPLHLAASVFRRDSRNLIDFDPTLFIYGNIARARAEGFELEAGGKLGENVRAWASYTYVKARDLVASRDLARRPRNLLSLGADWKTPLHGMTLGADLRVSSSAVEYDFLGTPMALDSYAVLTLRASVPLTEKIELFGRIENVTDERYETSKGFGTPGRSAYIGARGAVLMRALVLLGMALLASCAPAEPRQAAPASGLRSIVSLNPCTDAVLAEVADEAQLLAISDYSQRAGSSSMDLARARRFRAVSGSAEEVLALRPDVVVAGTFLPPATAQAIRNAGIALVQLPIAETVEQSRDQVAQLAALAGHPTRGTALLARIDTALVQAAPSAGTRPVSAIVWQSGGIVPGDNTLIVDLLRRTGFASLSAQKGMKQADFLPLEKMLADPPAVILAAGDAQSEEDRLLSHPALAALKGTRRARLDPALLWCGGPTIIRAAQRLAHVRESL